jgi:hypothetical protein
LRANTLAHAKEVFVTISALRAGDDQRSQPEKERPSFVRLAQSGRLGFARAVPLRVGLDVRMERPGYDPFPQRDLGWCSYALLRPTIERTVRSRVEGQPNTTLRQRCRVQEVLATPNGEAVTGVRYENANDAPACGDGRSVVLASGRMFTVPAPINFEFETNEKRSNRSPVSPQQFLYCSFISSPTTTKAPKTSAEPISDFRLANRATKLCFFCPHHLNWKVANIVLSKRGARRGSRSQSQDRSPAGSQSARRWQLGATLRCEWALLERRRACAVWLSS